MRIRIQVVTVLLLCVALGACGGDDPPRPTDTSTTPAPPATAQQALALGGLVLPSQFDDLTFANVDVPQNRETYVVTFRTARKDALAICGTAGLGGDLPALRLSADDQKVLGDEADAGKDARYCSSMWPKSTSWNRTVLVEAGDPALVRIAVARQSR